tara:strand:+ start:403 stop:1311 length:909 start_codon:yes stop_codon:yes gene_type:complete
MTIYVGTNQGGDIADLAANLNATNSTEIFEGGELDAYVDKDANVLLGHSEFLGFSTTVAMAEDWNTRGYKEIKLEETSNELVYINNFVDVNINNQSDKGSSFIKVDNVKRADIDTGVGTDDVLDISVFTNGGSSTVNQLSLNTGSGDDVVTLSSDIAKSSHTVFNIDVGADNDIVDISGINNAKGAWADRSVTGGEGLDVLIFNEDAALEFDGFEVLESGTAGGVLSLDEDEVINNSTAEGVLVVSGFDVDFEFAATNIGTVDAAQGAYLDSLGFDATDFEVITANIDGSEYTLLVDDVEVV